MGRTKPGRGLVVVLVVGVTACIAWLSWAWSPEVEDMPAASEDAEPAAFVASAGAAPSEPIAQPAAEQAAPIPAQAEPAAAALDASRAANPERVPTPHPLSLDQAKPPEQYGALAELKNQYDSESRSAESSGIEAGLRALITTPNVPAELVQNILCRRSLCKIDMHWTPRGGLGFSVVFERFKQLYSQRVAIEPAAAPSADGSYFTTLYMRLTP